MEQNEGVTIPGEHGEEHSEPNPVEEKAKAQGWVPKEEFKGDPAKWIDADTFVKRGEEIIPILKERTRHLETKLDEQGKTIKEFADHYKGVEQRAYKRAVDDLERKRLEAVQKGDVAAFRATEKELHDLNTAQGGGTTQAEAPEMQQFRRDNVWYDKDPEMTADADAFGIMYAKKGMPYGEILKNVERRMKALYPDKFGNPRRSDPASVEGGGNDTGIPRKKSARTYENLPEDAKKQCTKFVEQGLLTREQYLADYEWE